MTVAIIGTVALMTRSEKQSLLNNKSLWRALEILTVFNAERPSFTLSELSETLAIPKPRFRLCSTLVQYEFLRFKEIRRNTPWAQALELRSVVFAYSISEGLLSVYREAAREAR